MKKVVLGFLVVLIISVAFLACELLGEEDTPGPGPTGPTYTPAMEPSLVTYLNGKSSGLATRIKTPADTNFFDWDDQGAGFYIVWKDATLAKFNAYKTAWGANASSSNMRATLFDEDATGKAFIVNINGLDNESEILFFPKAGDLLGAVGGVSITIPANCIVLRGYFK